MELTENKIKITQTETITEKPEEEEQNAQNIND